jgi:hypothetical protein
MQRKPSAITPASAGINAHLAVAFCRCMNIPARAAPVISAISACRLRMRRWISQPGSKPISAANGTPLTRNNVPRIGRVLIARGRDAADVAISTSFGPNTLSSFTVWTEAFAAVE